MRGVFIGFCLIALTAHAVPKSSSEKLILVGGGDYPTEAMQQMAQWAGGEKARFLIISWATESPEAAFQRIREALLPYHPAAVVAAPIPDASGKQNGGELLSDLKEATGVFFTGGDQNLILDRMQSQHDFFETLKEKFHHGMVVGGSSAGTAVMPERAMTGKADLSVIDGSTVEMRPGLGFIRNAIVDQHFIRRQRENRLFGLLLTGPEMVGIGIDQDTAIAVVNSRYLTVLGPQMVMIVNRTERKRQFAIDLLQSGEKYDLANKKTLIKGQRPARVK